jgi:O-antigen ligase
VARLCHYPGAREGDAVPLAVLAAVAAAPLLVAYVIACVRDPLRYALPPYLVSLPFSSLVAVAPGPFGSVSSLLGLLLGATLLIQLITTRRSVPRLPLVVPVWLGFLAWCGLTAYWSIAPVETANRFGLLASLVLLFVALALTRFDRRAIRRFENAILLGSVVVVLYGLVQLVFLGGFPTPDGGAPRFGGDLLGPNNQAAALLLPIAIATGRALKGSLGSRLVHAAVLLLFLFGVFMTGSRGGLLATVVTLVAVLCFEPTRRAAALSLAAAATVLIAIVLVVNPGGVGQRQIEDGTDASGRAEIWAIGLHACPVHCLAGAGWGSFPTVYAQQRAEVPQARVLDRGTAFEAHNVYLLVAVETGVVGFLFVTLGLGLALTGGLRLPAGLRGPPVAAMIGTLVSSFFLSDLEYKFFWAVLSYIAILATAVDVTPSPTPRISTPARRQAVPAGQDQH